MRPLEQAAADLDHAEKQCADLERQLTEQKQITDSIISVDVAGLRKAWNDAMAQLRASEAAQAGMRAALERVEAHCAHPQTNNVEVLVGWVLTDVRAALASSGSGLLDAVREGAEALEWYGERAKALTEFKKQPPMYPVAIFTELSLDGGRRARAALEKLGQYTH